MHDRAVQANSNQVVPPVQLNAVWRSSGRYVAQMGPPGTANGRIRTRKVGDPNSDSKPDSGPDPGANTVTYTDSDPTSESKPDSEKDEDSICTRAGPPGGAV